jgi:hypothetical protein
MGLPVPGCKGCHKKTRPEAEFEVESAVVMKKVTPSVAHILLTTSRGQLNLEDLSALLHNPLLFSEPTVIGHPLGEIGVLEFPLTAHILRARDAGRDLEETHG